MRIPRDVNGLEAVRAFRRLGWAEIRQTGSHRILRRESKTIVVPMHKPLKPGTLSGIIEQAGLTVEEFTAEL